MAFFRTRNELCIIRLIFMFLVTDVALGSSDQFIYFCHITALGHIIVIYIILYIFPKVKKRFTRITLDTISSAEHFTISHS